MPTTDELTAWCDTARKLLSRTSHEGPNEMGRHVTEVADLLKKLATEPSKQTEYNAFHLRYEKLAIEAKRLTDLVAKKKLSEKKARPEVKEVSLGLKQLKEEMRLVLGSVDPTATPKVREAVLTAARHKPVYDDKRDRIQAAIKELEASPGTKAQVTKLTSLLKAGEEMEPDYEAAYKALAGLTKALEGGRAAAEKFATKAGGDVFQPKLTAARNALEKYANLAGVADASGVDFERAQIAEALGSLDVPPPGPSPRLVNGAVQKLNMVMLRLKKKTDPLELIGPQLEQYEDRLTPLMEQLDTWASAEVMAPLLDGFQGAVALAGSQQLPAAFEAFKKIDDPIVKANAEYKVYFDQWAKLDEEFTNKHQSILARVDKTMDPMLNGIAGPLRDTIDRRLRIDLVPRHYFKEAIELVKSSKVIEDLNELGRLVRLFEDKKPVVPNFADEERSHSAAVLALRGPIRTASLELDAPLTKLAKDGGLRAPHDAERTKINIQWTDAESPALDQSQPLPGRKLLLPALTKLSGDLTGQLNAIKQQLAQPGNLDQSKLDKAKAEEGDKFDAQRKLTERALAFLDEYGVPETHPIMAGTPALKSLKKDCADYVNAAKTGVYQLARMEKLASDADAKRILIENDLKNRRTQANLIVKELTGKIDGMAKGNKDYQAFFDSLSDKVTDCTGLVSSTTVIAVEAGEKSLAELQIEINALAVKMGNKTTNFKAVEAKLDEFKSTLKESVVKDYEPATQAGLMTRLEKVLPGTLKSLSPEQALKTLAEFGIEVTEVKRLADEAKLNRQQIATAAGEARTALAGIKTTAPDLFAALEKRIKAAEKADKGREKQALLEIEAVRMLIADAKSDPTKSAEMNKKVVLDKLEAERVGVAFKAARDIFEKNGKRQADERKSEFGGVGRFFVGDCNIDAYEQMGHAFDEAKKLGDSEDYAAAMDKLNEASRLAKYFVAHPFNPSATARKALKKLNEAWKTAVGGYLKGLADLKIEVAGECKKDQTVGVNAAQDADKALDPLAALFDAAAFEDAAALLSKAMDPKTVGTRRAQKEDALLNVRRYQRVLADNQLLKTAIDNPFAPISITPLSTALTGLNGALLVS